MELPNTLDTLFKAHGLVTIEEVAVAFRVCTATIINKVHQFGIPPINPWHKPGGWRYRLSRQQVEQLFSTSECIHGGGTETCRRCKHRL